MSNKKDDIFAKPVSPLPFRFDESVAEVFPDMISRSVPGYQSIIRNVSKLATHFVTDNSNCYDLGCSLGAVSLAMSSGITANNAQIIGVD
ncbi:MAG: carboxy-S-adenosyl-L-methionine synthase CmoA, partial [Kangiellaceae bacterium]|nr:carboxy-S-adenosyl-L-methionine synthase CmoA [Kangiellaceae bacterium]